MNDNRLQIFPSLDAKEPLHKKNILTLKDVFCAFKKVATNLDCLVPKMEQWKKNKVYFEYDSKMWVASITETLATYKENIFNFVTIKLPLAGSLLADEGGDGAKDERELDAETVELIELLQSIVPFCNPRIKVHYKPQIEVCYWNRNKQECVTIKFVNKSYSYLANRNRYTLDELKKQINAEVVQ